MKVIRKVEKEVKKFKVGDQITLGRYTATAMAQDESGTTFCLDQVYGEKPMAYSDRKRIKALYNSKMFDEVRDLMVSFYPKMDNDFEPWIRMLRSPTAEEIWGKQITSGIHPTIIEGADRRWEAMKDIRNRTGFGRSRVAYTYWIDSLIGKEADIYNVVACCNGETGAVNLLDESKCVFFRPVFKLKG